MSIVVLLGLAVSTIQAQRPADKMEWFRDAKFGMFIHWGIYSKIAGEWKGEQKYSAFVMLQAKIPVKEYEQVAAEFNPVDFDAEAWVLAAKRAGMKYLVYTSKHHEGFAMYHSKCSPYNIYDHTPFKRDPLAELSAACKKHGIKLGIYYSLGRDWHDPDAATSWPVKGGRSNTWDFPDEDAKDVNRYIERKVKPQIKELLEQYNPDLIWFDTPELTPRAQSIALRKMILDYNPNIIINNRIGNGQGDYGTVEQKKGDEINRKPWEACMTLSGYWCYLKNDSAYKSPQKLIGLLIDTASKGGNLLLNVGPTPEGVILQPNIDRLDRMGEWLQVNGEAIYGSEPWKVYGEEVSDVKDPTKIISKKGFEDDVYDATGGVVQDIRFTVNNGYLYVFARDWRTPEIRVRSLAGSAGKVKSVELLGCRKKVEWKQTDEELSVRIPDKAKNDLNIYTLKVKLEEP